MTVLPRMAYAERIDPARGDPARKLLALFRQKAARFGVVFRAGEIDLLVRRVEVADHEHLAALSQPLHALEHGPIEVELVRHAAVVAVLAAALREIAVDDEQLAEAGRDQPALDRKSTRLNSSHVK